MAHALATGATDVSFFSSQPLEKLKPSSFPSKAFDVNQRKKNIDRSLCAVPISALNRSARSDTDVLPVSPQHVPKIGLEVRTGDVAQPIMLKSGQEFTFTIRPGVGTESCVSVNYDDFVDDVEVGDTLLIDADGGMMSLMVKSKTEDAVNCEVVDGGELKSRRHLNVRGKSTKNILRHLENRLQRSKSSKELYNIRTRMQRSQSVPQLRRTINPEPKYKSSLSFPFLQLSNSLGSSPFESDYSNEMIRLEDSEDSNSSEGEKEMEKRAKDSEDSNSSEGEKEMEKRANWVGRLLELRSHWRNRQKDNKGGMADEDDGEDDEDHGCDVDYGSENQGVEYNEELFSRFLVRVPWSETKPFSRLAFLCNMAYVIQDLKAEDLRRHYDLRFVTSSLQKKAEAIKAQLDLDSIGPAAIKSEQKLLFRPSVAYDIAACAASYIHTRTKGLLSLPLGSFSSDNDDDEDNEKKKKNKKKLQQQLEETRGGGQEDGKTSPSSSRGVYKSEVAAYVAAASTMTTMVAAEETAKQEVARDLLHSSPCEWFVCDDPTSCTRCFVIQGSDSLASWQANLFFEPTKFEGTEVLVHRGIYEAAKGLYEQFMPEILDHLKTHRDRARFQFTGHSLGGSLCLLVHLMLLARGVAKPSTLLPVITFGSPFVFCGGQSILEYLGLDEGHICSVMMHRDIVPRAFSCNYPNHVAQVLKRISGSFRSHPCLNKNKQLYTPLGQIFVLQPDEESSPHHPLLPPGSALYALDNKTQGDSHVSIDTALRAFLNSPHPLETLSDPTAYGSEGTILRDHDSSNYLKAINGVLRQHTKWLARRSRRERLHHWWPVLAMSPPTFGHEGSSDNPAMVSKEVATGV